MPSIVFKNEPSKGFGLPKPGDDILRVTKYDSGTHKSGDEYVEMAILAEEQGVAFRHTLWFSEKGNGEINAFLLTMGLVKPSDVGKPFEFSEAIIGCRGWGEVGIRKSKTDSKEYGCVKAWHFDREKLARYNPAQAAAPATAASEDDFPY